MQRGAAPSSFFRLPFTFSSIESLWQSSFAPWTLRNRFWIGLIFSLFHFIHLGLIVSMTVLFPNPFVSEHSMAQWVFGRLICFFDGTHPNRSGPALDGDGELEASSLCLKSLDLDAFFTHLCETR